jgi:hypothetical protein
MAEELGVWTSFKGLGDIPASFAILVAEVAIMVRPYPNVAFGVEGSELDPRSDAEKASLQLLGGGIDACEHVEKEVKKDSADVEEETEFLFGSLSAFDCNPILSPSPSSSGVTTMAALFSVFALGPVTVLLAVPISRGGGGHAEPLKQITLPFPPTFKPLPTTPTGIADEMLETVVLGSEGLVSVGIDIDIVLPVVGRPWAFSGCATYVDGLTLSDEWDKGANGRGGRILAAGVFDKGPGVGLVGTDGDIAFDGPLELRGFSPNVFLMSALDTGIVETGSGLEIRKPSMICCTRKGSTGTC